MINFWINRIGGNLYEIKGGFGYKFLMRDIIDVNLYDIYESFLLISLVVKILNVVVFLFIKVNSLLQGYDGCSDFIKENQHFLYDNIF